MSLKDLIREMSDLHSRNVIWVMMWNKNNRAVMEAEKAGMTPIFLIPL